MANPKDQTPYIDRPSARAIHRAVQNVMFNELGIDKKAIRAQVKAEIMTAAGSVVSKATVEDWIINAISKAIYGKWDQKKIKNLIDKTVQSVVEKHVKREVDIYLANNLTINIKVPGK